MNATLKFSGISLFLVLASLQTSLYAQNAGQADKEEGGQYPATLNNASNPCITPQQYVIIEKRIADNVKLLKPDNSHHKTTSTLFSWPLQPAAGLTDCSYYYIGNYVDEDPTAGIKDYNCGTVSYDGHHGTDICTGPYPFLKMDNNMVNVIAGAPGTIVDKQDGHFDKNCAMNTDTANYIIIQHADGSVALYWHMKKFSLTSKIVGQTVAAGEFLGVVGSSGSSTAPHLHFEVWSTTLSASIKDPWAGSCNSLGGATWWAAQKPYTEPALLRAQVNSILVVLPTCPATESPNEDSCFAPGATAKFYFFLRNETIGDTVYERIVNPGGSTFTSWTHNSITNYLASYWYFNKLLPTTPGIYTYETKYNGTTCTKNFMVNCSVLGLPTVTETSEAEVYPNPANNSVTVALRDIDNGTYCLAFKNLLGQVVLKNVLLVQNNNGQKSIDISALANGIYFVTIESKQTRIVRKIVKQ